jgi:hypothetical protein
MDKHRKIQFGMLMFLAGMLAAFILQTITGV